MSLEENDALKVGDVVTLKSGSCRLTVIAVDGEEVTVAWHSYLKQKSYRVMYPAACLEKNVEWRKNQPTNDHPTAEDLEQADQVRKNWLKLEQKLPSRASLLTNFYNPDDPDPLRLGQKNQGSYGSNFPPAQEPLF